MVKNWQDLSVLILGCGSIGKRHARVLNGLGVHDLRACDPVAAQRESLLAHVPTRADVRNLRSRPGRPARHGADLHAALAARAAGGAGDPRRLPCAERKTALRLDRRPG